MVMEMRFEEDQAVETRQDMMLLVTVKIKSIRISHLLSCFYFIGKYLAISIYTVALAAVLGFPALGVTSNNISLYFLVLSLSIVIPNTLVLCMIFVPKVSQ